MIMLWVGLGNPGTSYAKNRHNVGFMALDKIASDYSFSEWCIKGQSASCEGRIGTDKIRLLKPLSFMNRSGLPVTSLAQYYSVPAEQVIVFHDDIDLEAGRLRVKQGGGHGGHNGLRDIDRHLGKNYWRVRIGVGRPEIKTDVDKWVLSDFSKQEQDGWLKQLLEAIATECPYLTGNDMASFASRIAWRAPAPDTKPEDKQEDSLKVLRTGDKDGV